MPQAATLAISDGLVAYQLGKTAIQVFNVQRQQMPHDVVDKRSLKTALPDEVDCARIPTVPPLSTCAGLPESISACVLVGHDLVAACRSFTARWNIKTGALLWMHPVPFATRRLIDASAAAGGRGKVLVEDNKHVHCIRLRDGAVLWSTAPVPTQPGLDDLVYTDDERGVDKEDAEDTAHEMHATVKGTLVDPRRNIAWAVFDRTLLPFDLASGAFLTGSVRPCLRKPQRRAAYRAAKARGEPLRFEAAKNQFMAQQCGVQRAASVDPLPSSAAKLATKWRVGAGMVPDCEDGATELVLVPGAAPDDDLLVVSSTLAGVYAFRASGAPVWCYFPLWGGGSPDARPEVAARRSAGQDKDNPHEALETLCLLRQDGKRYLVGAQYSRHVVCLDAESGAELWAAQPAQVLKAPQANAAVTDMDDDAEDISTDFAALRLLRQRGLVLYMADSGALAVWHVATGRHVMSATNGLLRRNAETHALAVVEHPVGTVVSEWAQGDPDTQGVAAPAWNSKAALQLQLHASLCIRNNDTDAILGLQLTSPVGAGVPPAASSDGAAPPVVGPRDTPGMPLAVQPRWFARAHKPHHQASTVAVSPEHGLFLGKGGGDIEAWNVTRHAARWAKQRCGHAASQLVRWETLPAEYAGIPPGAQLDAQGQPATQAARDLVARAVRRAKESGVDGSDLSDHDVEVLTHVPSMHAVFTWHQSGTVRRWCALTGALQLVARVPGDPYGIKAVQHIPTPGTAGGLLVYVTLSQTVPCLFALRAVDCTVALCLPLLPGFDYEPDVELQHVEWDEQRGLSVVVGLLPVPLDEDDIADMQPGAVDVPADSAHPAEQAELWGPVVRPGHTELAIHADNAPQVLLHVCIAAAALLATAGTTPSSAAAAAAGSIDGNVAVPPADITHDAADPLSGRSDDSSTDGGGGAFVRYGTSSHITHRTLLTHTHVSVSEMFAALDGSALIGRTEEGLCALDARCGRLLWTWHAAEDAAALAALESVLKPARSRADIVPRLVHAWGDSSCAYLYVHVAHRPSERSGGGNGADPSQCDALLALDVKSRSIHGAAPYRAHSTVLRVAPGGAAVVVARAVEGLSLLHPATLQPLHEHPYQFDGTPSHMEFMYDGDTGAKTNASRALGALPSRVVAIGTDAQLLEVDVAAFLGPLHLSPQIDLSQLLSLPEGIWRKWDIGMFYVGLALALLLVFVDFAQMASFALSSVTPPSLEGSAQTVQQFQALGLVGVTVDFKLVFWLVVGLLLPFFALIGSSESIEDFVFRRREDQIVQIVWTAVAIVAQLMTSVAVIPLTRVLVGAFDCVPRGDGRGAVWHAVAPDTVRCFSGEHLPYVAVSAALLLVYFPLVLRLLRVRNDLSRVELRLAAPWDWSGDDRSAPQRLHVLSQTASVFGVVQAVAKLLSSVVFVLLGARYPEWSAVAVLALGAAVLASGLRSPPYHYAVMNALRTALDAGVVWTYAVAVVAAFVLGTGDDRPAAGSATDVALSLLPAGILFVIPAVFLLRRRQLKRGVNSAATATAKPVAASSVAPPDGKLLPGALAKGSPATAAAGAGSTVNPVQGGEPIDEEAAPTSNGPWVLPGGARLRTGVSLGDIAALVKLAEDVNEDWNDLLHVPSDDDDEDDVDDEDNDGWGDDAQQSDGSDDDAGSNSDGDSGATSDGDSSLSEEDLDGAEGDNSAASKGSSASHASASSRGGRRSGSSASPGAMSAGASADSAHAAPEAKPSAARSDDSWSNDSW